MFYSDYHIHSYLSTDSKATMDDICQNAIQNGIGEIVLTDHYDPFNEDIFCEKTYNAAQAFADVSEMQSRYGKHLSILCGVESGQSQLYPESTKKLLLHPFDYVIGSLHNITGDIDLALVDYKQIDPHKLFEQYFRELILLAKTGLYDCIGHIDYPRRYYHLAGGSFSIADYGDLLVVLLKEIIYRGKGIEVNTSGKRGSLQDTMPGLDVLKLYRNLGGEIITIGSDAHLATDVGRFIPQTTEMFPSLGIRYVTRYAKRIPHFEKII